LFGTSIRHLHQLEKRAEAQVYDRLLDRLPGDLVYGDRQAIAGRFGLLQRVHVRLARERFSILALHQQRDASDAHHGKHVRFLAAALLELARAHRDIAAGAKVLQQHQFKPRTFGA
jgi:hypothetical protein